MPRGSGAISPSTVASQVNSGGLPGPIDLAPDERAASKRIARSRAAGGRQLAIELGELVRVRRAGIASALARQAGRRARR